MNIVYFTTADRDRLVIINDKLPIVDGENRNKLELEKSAILARRKSFSECDLEELNDLRGQYLNKYVMLARLRSPNAPLLQNVIRTIDKRIQLMHNKMIAEPEHAKKKNITKKSTDDQYSWDVDIS